MMRLPAAALALLWALPAAAYAPACLNAAPVPIRVRIAEYGPEPVEASLQGGVAPALSLLERSSGRLLWSADFHAPAAQQFTAMRAAFAGSLTALDLDGDGLQDRIYAGDLGGRLWRFDLHHGAPAAAWASGGIFADFSNPAGRGFVAPPDVSLALPSGSAPWFNIALGTAAPGNVATGHRYYVLRDHAPFESWSAQEYLEWHALHESDLLPLQRPTQAGDLQIEDGYFIELARGEVLSPSITVAGRAVLAIADSTAAPATQCKVAISVATLQVDTARDTRSGDARTPWREPLGLTVAAGTVFAFTTASDSLLAPCTLGDAHVAACDVDLSPVRTWWRREDAE
jgi:hypothetical protein